MHSSKDLKRTRYLALCLGGCEEEIAADIRKCLMTHPYDERKILEIEILGASHTKRVSKGESGCGKLRIQSDIEIEQVSTEFYYATNIIVVCVKLVYVLR